MGGGLGTRFWVGLGGWTVSVLVEDLVSFFGVGAFGFMLEGLLCKQNLL